GRRCAETCATAVGEEGAQIGSVEVEQAEAANLFATIPAEKLDQTVCGGNIGPNGVRAAAAVIGEIVGPTRRDCARRKPFPLQPFLSHRRSIGVKLAPEESQQFGAMPIVEAGGIML